jgi:plastocyanin
MAAFPLFGRRARTVLPAVLLATVALTAPSAANAETASRDWTVLVGNESNDMAIQGMRFLPGEIWVDAGDTVTWQANSAEIHTVTFFPGGEAQDSLPPFNPFDPNQILPVGGSDYDPAAYLNSGIMSTSDDVGPFPQVPIFRSYSLTFHDAGDFTYYCLVHGVMMVGTVHVRDAGTAYPYTQAQYDRQATLQGNQLVADGMRLRASTLQDADRHRVMMGADDDEVMLMRFLRGSVTVPVGGSVTFVNPGMLAPHTVTFGAEPPGPAVFAPSGDPTSYAGGDLNSGILEPGSTFTVTFTKAGTYPYLCALHDDMGMVGRVLVRG